MSYILVFGSNLAGRHGKGTALLARKSYGAKYGVGVGPTGSAYAIPTKGYKLEVLPLSEIQKHVNDFIAYAKQNDWVKFYVVKIGCGLAGYREDEIKPMFKDAPSNCVLPEGWRENV